jgi:hypothetical protein
VDTALENAQNEMSVVIVAKCEHGGSRGDTGNVGVDLGHGDLGGGALCVSAPRISPSHPHPPTSVKCNMALSPMLCMPGVSLLGFKSRCDVPPVLYNDQNS